MPLIQAIIGGGLGNKLFGYCFARAYAEKMGCDLEVQGGLYPQKWNIVFQGTDHPAVSRELPIRQSFDFEKWEGQTDIRIEGFCQHQKNLIYTRRQIREWLRFTPEVEEMVAGIESVQILCNQRLGDYCLPCNPFAWVSRESYIECANRFGLGASNITWQDGDTHYPWPGIDASLFKRHEHHAEFDERMDFLPDFVVMMRAKNLIRANSTFGWWAHELGSNERVFCPDVTKVDANQGVVGLKRVPQFVPFVEGNHMPVVPGIPYLSELHLAP
jgi:hypothetical protein